MTAAEQREKVRAEVRRRMQGPDALERLTDLVEEWRKRALQLATAPLQARVIPARRRLRP